MFTKALCIIQFKKKVWTKKHGNVNKRKTHEDRAEQTLSGYIRLCVHCCNLHGGYCDICVP